VLANFGAIFADINKHPKTKTFTEKILEMQSQNPYSIDGWSMAS
jgi:hypothetical protein